jgi:hypothetical protein
MLDPREPGLGASAVNWGVRQLVGDKTQAEESLQKAYGGEAPSMGASAMATPTDFSTGAGGTFGNGEWAPWYSGNPNPYSLTGNMNEMAMWGPGTKYVMQEFDTN